MESTLRNRLILPSIVYLLVVLFTGTWIRVQWTWPEYSIFNAKYLIHAHSHLAMLGWLFPALMAFLISGYVKKTQTSPLISWWIILPMHILIIGMTVAFTLQGYAFWSITASTLFIIVSSIWVIMLLIQMDDDLSASTLLLKLAAFSYLASNVGPLALSGGTMFGESWIMFWVSYYLHIQFSLWIPLAIFAIIIKLMPDMANRVSKHFNSRVKICVWMYFIGSIFLTESMTRMYQNGFPEWIGFTGSIIVLFSTGFLVTLGLRIRAFQHDPVLEFTFRLGLILFLVKAGLHVPASIPNIGIQFMQNHFLKIGFTHLVLLGSYTLLMYSIILDLFIRRNKNRNHESISIRHNFGTLTFLIGSCFMILVLFLTGVSVWTGHPLPFPLQETLLICGVISVSGYASNLLFFKTH